MYLMTKSRSYLSFFVVMCLTQELAAFAALLVQGFVLTDKGSFVNPAGHVTIIFHLGVK